jgi:hypothetical protein
MRIVPTRETAFRRGTEHGRALVRRLCDEAETSRVERGTSFATLGRAIGLGGGQVARICRGQSPGVSVVRLAQLLSLLGLELSARAFPVGPPIRDAAQVRLLDRLRKRLAPDLVWRSEVAVLELPTAGTIDRRAWDGAIDGPTWTARVDAETHLGDAQAVLRRVALKQRDSGVSCVILLLSESRHHRRVLDEIREQIRATFPVPARRALVALRDGRSPGANAIILL